MLLVGPILRRDLVGFLRTRWAFVVILVTLSLTTLVVFQRWTTIRDVWILGAVEFESLSGVQEVGRRFFHELIQGQLLILTLVSPLLTATAVAGERERDTLTLLLSSPVRTGRVLFEKFASSQTFVLLLMIGTLPPLSVSLLAGGLAMDEILASQLLCFCAALGYSLVGLFCSTLRPRVYETYLLTGGAILIMALLVPFGPQVWHYITTLKWESPDVRTFGWHDLSPYVAMERILGSPGGRLTAGPVNLMSLSRATFAGTPFWGLCQYALVWLPVGFLLYYWSVRRLDKLATGDQPRTSFEEEDDETEADEARRAGRHWDTDGNPVLTLEGHRQWFGRLAVLLRLLYTALLISVITLPLASYRGSWLFFTLPFVAASLFTVPLAATTLGNERGSKTLDLLRTTLVGDRRIVRAKFTVALRLSLLLSLTLYLPGLVTLLFYSLVLGGELDLLTNLRDVFTLLAIPVLLYSSLTVYNAVGVRLSSRIHSPHLVLAASTLTVLGLLLLPLPGLHALNGLGWGPSQFGPIGRLAIQFGVAAPLIAINPLAILVLLSTHGNIELLGLRIQGVTAPFESTSPLFLLIYVVLCTLTSRWLLRGAERSLWR